MFFLNLCCFFALIFIYCRNVINCCSIMKLEVFDSSREALRAVSDHLAKAIEDSHLKPFHLALSGGDTAQLLFKVWTEEYREKIDWDAIRFYWVDERCGVA